jgi:hypothetical protein
MEKEYFQFNNGDKMGIETIEDGTIIPAIYDFVEPFSDGLFNVKEGNTHAYFDCNGAIIIPFESKYDSYGNFTNGLARVRRNGNWGFINKSGHEVIKLQFHFAEEFSDDYAIVRNPEDKYGVINITGELIIDYQFRYLGAFKNGYARFGDHKTYGLIDKNENIVVPQEYIHIGIVEENKVKVQIKEGDLYKEGTLTLEGSVEWNNKLDKMNEFNKKKKDFTILCEELIETMYKDGCPCGFQRFRNFIEWWAEPITFVDQEILFSVFTKHLSSINQDEYSCDTCGTTYKRQWDEYSISMQVITVKILKKGNYKEKGAKLQRTIPVSLGFKGFDLDKLRKKYITFDNETVIKYLSEKAGASTVFSKQGKSWFKKLLGN